MRTSSAALDLLLTWVGLSSELLVPRVWFPSLPENCDRKGMASAVGLSGEFFGQRLCVHKRSMGVWIFNRKADLFLILFLRMTERESRWIIKRRHFHFFNSKKNFEKHFHMFCQEFFKIFFYFLSISLLDEIQAIEDKKCWGSCSLLDFDFNLFCLLW